MVMMWQSRSWLMMLSMLARVVVLPLPVGPVTRMRPRGLKRRSRICAGRPICSRVSIFDGIWRRTRPTWPFCRKMLTRKRARSLYGKPKSAPQCCSRPRRCSSGVMARMRRSVSAGVSGEASMGTSEPLMRMTGGRPTARWRSEAFSWTASSRRSSMRMSEDWRRSLISCCPPW